MVRRRIKEILLNVDFSAADRSCEPCTTLLNSGCIMKWWLFRRQHYSNPYYIIHDTNFIESINFFDAGRSCGQVHILSKSSYHEVHHSNRYHVLHYSNTNQIIWILQWRNVLRNIFSAADRLCGQVYIISYIRTTYYITQIHIMYYTTLICTFLPPTGRVGSTWAVTRDMTHSIIFCRPVTWVVTCLTLYFPVAVRRDSWHDSLASLLIRRHVPWRVQSGEYSENVLSYRSFSAKEPLIIGRFVEKDPQR